MAVSTLMRAPELSPLQKQIVIGQSAESIGVQAAEEILPCLRDAVRERGRAVVLFASAPSQHATWQGLIDSSTRNDRRHIFPHIHAFHMDEYLGLDSEARQLFGRVLKHRLYDNLGFDPRQTYFLDSQLASASACQLMTLPEAIDSEAAQALLRQIGGEAAGHVASVLSRFDALGGQFDVVVAGIGKHPHVAFNDAPWARFDEPEPLRVMPLTDTSRQQQVEDLEFERVEEVPRVALTWTLPPIFGARRLFVIVPRAFKAPAVRDTLDGEISPAIPASGLRQESVLPRTRFFFDPASSALSEVCQEMLRRGRS